MMIQTLSLWLMISITGVQVCTIPSLNLDCSNRKDVHVTWKEDCVINCNVIWNCTNGEDVSVVKRRSCATTWSHFSIPWESYTCNVTMNYLSYKHHEPINGKATRSCSAYSNTIQPVNKMVLNKPLEIHCSVNTTDITNSDEVTVSWTGPNGATITNDSRLTITPTVSNGTNHISTLQFSYLSEDDEGLYECSTTVLGYNENKTASVELTNFTKDDGCPKQEYIVEIKTILVVGADTFTDTWTADRRISVSQTVTMKKHQR